MKRFPIRLYINGVQVGSNSTFAERAESAEACAAESAEFYRGEGFTAVETEITMASAWPGVPEEETVIVRCSK